MNNFPLEIANQLFDNGAFLIIAGVPEQTEFGIDLLSFSVTGNFRGVKMIPPGPHYVYTASTGPYGDTALRVGFIHYFHEKEIVIREWDSDKEELRIRTKVNETVEKKRIRDNIKDLDKFLAPYDYSSLQKWKNLTETISENIIIKLLPETGKIRTSAEYESCSDAERPRGNSPLTRKITQRKPVYQDENDLLPNLKIVPGTAPRFTILPERCPKGATATEISSYHMDTIKPIDKLFNLFDKNFICLIEEIQFSFILYLCGCSVESLAHWRNLLGILSNSEMAINKYNLFYKRYLNILQYQIPELPTEVLQPTPFNTVYKDVKQLIINCANGGLKSESEIFLSSLSVSVEWHFIGIFDEDPEDLPVIVEI